MKDYRIPVEFTAVIAVPDHSGQPVIASISDPDVRVWVSTLDLGELLHEHTVVDPYKLKPGVYDVTGTTICEGDEVYLRFLASQSVCR